VASVQEEAAWEAWPSELEEVIVNSQTTEATASIKFQNGPADGDWYQAPYQIDSM
jgi:hypothetical protein